MSNTTTRDNAKDHAIHRNVREVILPQDSNGRHKRVSQYYGENTFDFAKAKSIPDGVRKEILEVSRTGKALSKENAEIVAKAVTEWALEKGATHFCHWFQPLTGSTAEKHDGFLSLDNGDAIEKFSAGQLMQGEPDASSFPNGGSRSTFEARGYTSWDLTSPMFISEGVNGKTLCIPTAFVSYLGDALDIKTPLLRSIGVLNSAATKFLNLIGEKSTRVMATCGAEQEYFLVDKALYFNRPDLVQTGRTLFGVATTKHQQLDDHYFGAIPERVKAFMDELNLELHRLGIPAKTQHNEVAPGQFELAPIFEDANVSADHNQLTMATIKNVARRHDLVALLHEKPFVGINGSGKHVNWSMADDMGLNLLEPGSEPHSNHRFLAVVSMIVEAVNRHSEALRMAISGHSNDHRLGANEAPPSIISVYLGDTLQKIYESIMQGKSFEPDGDNTIDIGATQLANLLKDNTDRNRTSPFAFTGNKFEFRAVGSSQTIGFPVSILNAAVAEVMNESNDLMEKEISSGKSIEDALFAVTKKWITNSKNVIFNGDGYSDEWVKEAEDRGLPNLRTTADALPVLADPSKTKFLTELNVFTGNELETRYNVLAERYLTLREIEFNTLIGMVQNYVIPAAISYKEQLSSIIKNQKDINLESSVEVEIYKRISFSLESLFATTNNLRNALEGLEHDDQAKAMKTVANEFLPQSEQIAEQCNAIEDLVPDYLWTIPKYFDLLFVR